MEITTLYQVGDLVQTKYGSPGLLVRNKVHSFFEVIEVQTQSCMAGTQVFYDCRVHEPLTERDVNEGKLTSKISGIALGWPGDRPLQPYIRVREDEVKPLTDEMVKLVKSFSEEQPPADKEESAT